MSQATQSHNSRHGEYDIAKHIKHAAHNDDMALSFAALLQTLDDASLELLTTLAVTERDNRFMRNFAHVAQDEFTPEYLAKMREQYDANLKGYANGGVYMELVEDAA
jgi:hypothetical protein